MYYKFSESWIKPGSKLFSHCVHILDGEKITEDSWMSIFVILNIRGDFGLGA